MFIIQKKRIMLLSFLVLVSILACSLNVNMVENSIETVALPVTNKVIVIDAGHGIPDEGAQSNLRNNRSPNKFKNSVEAAKLIGTIRSNSYIN